ncbi:MAG TPA: hypothetical protein VNT75_12945 [Symbiobacteriaceae bacterium]|nr:hypothetical protein [Symbiobacteriaceae bacterium]
MRLNLLFLVLGLILSAGSKLLQFRLKRAPLGNAVVFPAATFLVLAAIFSIPAFTTALGAPESRSPAIGAALTTCSAVAVFQLMMISFVRHKWTVGTFNAVVFLLVGLLALRFWLRIL